MTTRRRTRGPEPGADLERLARVALGAITAAVDAWRLLEPHLGQNARGTRLRFRVAHQGLRLETGRLVRIRK